jgi:hypothetical protein
MIIVHDKLQLRLKIVLTYYFSKWKGCAGMSIAFLTGTVVMYGIVMKYVMKNILNPS